ncbi:lipid-binding protein [Pedobacter yulinensis]|uniref:Lipid-binding protein n=1 Tax=Pedobacter yulinensis TaxID=2126353 RepID=A0A2T3HS07_9SPHI|nr:YceI family protein [Pedobacter yulinensis]PST85250.1 lipid-binding protein [Pedobacter yulinensis]
MKSTISTVLLVAVIAVMTAFKPAPVVYKVDTEKSTLTWIGKKVSGSHNGTLALQSGSLSFNGKKLNGGNFTIDMGSIKDADKSARLEGHLKADDFFGSAKYPTSTFVIKKVSPAAAGKVNITGDLTIKGKTNSISFPATVAWGSDGTVTATADKIVVDRTKFDIKYGSKSFFSDLGDKFIYDEFELAVKLVAKK